MTNKNAVEQSKKPVKVLYSVLDLNMGLILSIIPKYGSYIQYKTLTGVLYSV